jgi:signal transduction histidine kinase
MALPLSHGVTRSSGIWNSGRAPTPAADEAYAYLETTKEASLRAKKIVNQLLSYSRQTAADKEAVDVNRLVAETVHKTLAVNPETG